MEDLIILLGKSGSGKTTAAQIFSTVEGRRKIIQYTTRPIRNGEINGVDYNFISNEVFNQMKSNNEFLDTTCYNGWQYGIKISDLLINTDEKCVVIMTPRELRTFKDLHTIYTLQQLEHKGTINRVALIDLTNCLHLRQKYYNLFPKLKNKTLPPYIAMYLNDKNDNERLVRTIRRGDDINEVYRRHLSDNAQFDGIENEVDSVATLVSITNALTEQSSCK